MAFDPDNDANWQSLGIRRVANVAGCVIAFSDAHFAPGEKKSPAFIALLKLIENLKPTLIIDNGDSFDFPSISRHGSLDFRSLPSVSDELNFVKRRLSEIEEAAPSRCRLHRNYGNHDERLVKRLANSVPHFANVPGFSIDYHFPNWTHSHSLMLNEGTPGATMIRHKPVAGGVHASWASLLRAGGLHFVHGHLHRGQVTVFHNYLGTRYGVDCGTLSSIAPGEDQGKFDYDQDAPRNMGSGFAVLTYTRQGELLPPELVQVVGKKAYFRGSVV